MGSLQSVERFNIGNYSFPVSVHKRNLTRKFLIPKKLATHILANEKGYDNSSVSEIKTSHNYTELPKTTHSYPQLPTTIQNIKKN